MDLNGFKDDKHKLKNCTFTNIITPDNCRIVVKDADQLKFVDVKSVSGAKPAYEITASNNVVY